MPMTGEEAHYKGILDLLLNNTLSSVKIYRSANKVTWDISAKHTDIEQAKNAAVQIDSELKEKYP